MFPEGKCCSPAASFAYIMLHGDLSPLIAIITLFVADFLPICNRLLSDLAHTFPLLVQQSIQLLCDVEDTPSSLATGSARRGFPIPLQGTGFTEIVPTFGDDRFSIWFHADEAGEWDAL